MTESAPDFHLTVQERNDLEAAAERISDKIRFCEDPVDVGIAAHAELVAAYQRGRRSTLSEAAVDAAFSRLRQHDGIGWDRNDLRDAISLALAGARLS